MEAHARVDGLGRVWGSEALNAESKSDAARTS